MEIMEIMEIFISKECNKKKYLYQKCVIKKIFISKECNKKNIFIKRE